MPMWLRARPAAFAAAGALAGSACWQSNDKYKHTAILRYQAFCDGKSNSNETLPVLPILRKEDVLKRAGGEAPVWVILGSAVYDITTFVENHPGGAEKIMLAAGGSVEPFWALYRQHVMPSKPGESLCPKEHVAEILQPLQVGWLDPSDVSVPRSGDDPYAKEPERHPALKMLSETPCSAESPAALMLENWNTPNELWFVRNHHPVPHLDEEGYSLEVCGIGIAPHVYTLADLKRLRKTSVTATIQCGGNRRGGLNEVQRTSGNAWGFGAMSNATWGGVLMRDLLADCGLHSYQNAGVAHVQMEGDDGTKASIPAEKALSEVGDVLLAYEMNGQPLPSDHGYPLRAVVPGYVGVRNIKWLRKIVASDEEAEGVWQRGIAYKTFNPSVTAVDGIDVSNVAPMQEMPVTSFIVSPSPGTTLDTDDVTVAGIAWSGGGRRIVRVDVSADGGNSWYTAQLREGSEQPNGRAWAWTFWDVTIDIPVGRDVTIVSKAVDAAHNTQPESPRSVWNLRGLGNNSWHKVHVNIER
eukprot:CAMPEP_0119321010 /NCGR_PEP_ID=MMETSP1333-20130426/54139_1 /TAXON_ID=418940 /ORGANISM="Scyphosphaera apsteinii, Strain RCC1455" /LENGTH=525 /DNA_ID=CAMNT_0007327867 /DNA_START=23 /DNA_END=1600 /DNA_ORIENTATION=+